MVLSVGATWAAVKAASLATATVALPGSFCSPE